jgi:hypothetical protein
MSKKLMEEREKFYGWVIRTKGIMSESDYIEKFDEINFYNETIEEEIIDIKQELKIISENNEWAKKKNWSKDLKLFLKLKGVDTK